MTGTLFDDEVQGHDAKQARGNPDDERPEHDSSEASAPGTSLLENGGKNQPRERRGRVFLGGILVFGLLIGGGIYYWLLTAMLNRPTTRIRTGGR